MALQTKILETKHYVYRVKVCNRLGWRDVNYANRTFDHIMKKVRKGKIKPFPGDRSGTYGVYFRGLVFIYAPEPGGKYSLITCYDTTQKQEQQTA